MHRDANVWAAHVTALQQLVEDSIDGVCGKGHGRSACERRVVETKHTARRVDERPARESIVDGEIESQDAIDARAPSLPGTPAFANCADDAEAGGDVAAWPTDREHERADA